MTLIDFAVFNEVSASDQAVCAADALGWLRRLMDVMKRARRLHVHRLRTRHDFRSLELVAGTRFDQLVSSLGKDQRELLYRVLQSPYLDDAYEESFLSYSLISAGGQVRTDAEGLLCAHVLDALAISFDNQECWNADEVELRLRHDRTQAEIAATIRHASRPDHLSSHVCWASRRTCGESQLTPLADRPLPNSNFSNQLVGDDWDAFYRATSALPVAERTARLRELAKMVAYVNGYDYAEKISAINHQRVKALRQVFVSRFTPVGHELYLSTDFEKASGAFEVLDRRGRHLGEWLFSGRKNGGADPTGMHDIVL